MWLQHDGPAAHFARQVREHLTATYNDRWIGFGGPVAWPPKPPDLTPLDLFLWCYMETFTYSSLVDSVEDLIALIAEAAATIRQEPGIFERTRQSLLRHCWLCIEVGGRTFEHLL